MSFKKTDKYVWIVKHRLRWKDNSISPNIASCWSIHTVHFFLSIFMWPWFLCRLFTTLLPLTFFSGEFAWDKLRWIYVVELSLTKPRVFLKKPGLSVLVLKKQQQQINETRWPEEFSSSSLLVLPHLLNVLLTCYYRFDLTWLVTTVFRSFNVLSYGSTFKNQLHNVEGLT